MNWNDIDLKTWRAYENARARYEKDSARYRRILCLRWCLGYGLLCLFGLLILLSVPVILGAGAISLLIAKDNNGFLFTLFGFALFSGLYLLVCLRRAGIAGMPLDPKRFGRLYDEVNEICRDQKIAPIRRIYLDLSNRITVVSPFLNFTNVRIDRLVIGYPLICAMDARSFRVCLMRALMVKKTPRDPLLKWLCRVWTEATESLYAARTYRRSLSGAEKAEMYRFYALTGPLQLEEARDRDASCRETFGARDFAAAVTRVRFLAERCDPQTLLLRGLAEGPVQHLTAVIRDEVRKTLPEVETKRLLGRMIRASEPVMETRPAFRECVGTDDPAALLPYLQGAPDAAERYLSSCAEFEAEFNAWLTARIRKAKTDEVVRRLKEKEALDEASGEPAAWTAALDAAARLGHFDRERDLLGKALEKFPDNMSFRGKQLARRIRDAASDEEELDAAAELEHLTEANPALVLEFHGVLYDSAVRRGNAEHVRRLFAARESAKKRLAEMKRGKTNMFVAVLLLVGMLVLVFFAGFIFLQLLTGGKYGFRGYFIGGAQVIIMFCWIAVQDRKERRERKAGKAPAPATPFDDAAMFPSPEPEEAPPVEINPGGFRLSPNWLFGVLFVLFTLAGFYHIIRTERELGRIMEAAMTAYEAKDFETAARHVRAAAELNDAEAQCMLGVFYAEGRGVEQDYAEAVKWFRKAAKDSKYRKGISGAKCRLGDCYAEGHGVEQDYDKALTWYRRAAKQGNHIAQRKLGDCYAEGHDVEQNLDEAAKWYRLAAEYGDDKAEAALERLEAQRAEP